jgi:hypothetical protein
MKRIRNKIRPEIAEVQCEFVKNSDIRNSAGFTYKLDKL